MAYEEATRCFAADNTRNKNSQKDDRIHGGLLLLNELLRVSDVKFEVNPSNDCHLFFKMKNDLFRVFVKI